MSVQDNEALARAAHEAYNARDYDGAGELAAEDLEWVNVATGQTFRGPEGLKQYQQSWAGAFPDSTTEITNVFAGADFAVVEFVGQGTHTGPLNGPAGEIPATNRSVEVSFCEVHAIRDGKIARSHTYFDLATMMAQLGLMPDHAGA